MEKRSWKMERVDTEKGNERGTISIDRRILQKRIWRIERIDIEKEGYVWDDAKNLSFFVPVFTGAVYRWWELIKAGVESACGIRKKRSFKRGRYAGNSRSRADRIEVHDVPPFLPFPSLFRSRRNTDRLSSLYRSKKVKSADVEKCQGVKRYRMLGNRKQIYIYIWIYTFVIVGEAWKAFFIRGKIFIRVRDFSNLHRQTFSIEREGERNHFVLFRSFKLEKRKKLRFSRPHSVKSY